MVVSKTKRREENRQISNSRQPIPFDLDGGGGTKDMKEVEKKISLMLGHSFRKPF